MLGAGRRPSSHSEEEMEVEGQSTPTTHEANEGVSRWMLFPPATKFTFSGVVCRAQLSPLCLSWREGTWWETNSVTNGSIRRSICWFLPFFSSSKNPRKELRQKSIRDEHSQGVIRHFRPKISGSDNDWPFDRYYTSNLINRTKRQTINKMKRKKSNCDVSKMCCIW